MLFVGNGIGQLPFIMVRNRIREMKNIRGDMVNDCLCVWCCSCCVMVQAKREFEP